LWCDYIYMLYSRFYVLSNNLAHRVPHALPVVAAATIKQFAMSNVSADKAHVVNNIFAYSVIMPGAMAMAIQMKKYWTKQTKVGYNKNRSQCANTGLLVKHTSGRY